jgi:UDP-3-O-[3-hydroxymyristoyl] glucosamine N-acyltransferase
VEVKPIWIFGGSSYAQIAIHYFNRDTEFEVQGIILDEGFEPIAALSEWPITRTNEIGVLVDREGDAYFHAAITYAGINRLRKDKIAELTNLGMKPASYISPHAYVDDTVALGDHNFIFEDNTVQPFVTLGSGVVLWSGNHIGHHSIVEDDVFISSHVVVSGHCRIGERSFLGVNATLANNVSVGKANWILPNTFISTDTGDDEFWKPAWSGKSDKPASARAL